MVTLFTLHLFAAMPNAGPMMEWSIEPGGMNQQAKELFGPNPFVKDAFHDYVIAGRRDAVSTTRSGTKAAAHYVLAVPAGGSRTVRLRLSASTAADPFSGFEGILASRIRDADEFYDRISPNSLNEDERRVHRQALAGMLWSKQYYYFDLDRWLKEHDAHPLLGGARSTRNAEWFHMLNGDVISMPDKWEYPWYAAWDLAFHTIALSLVDFDFAKEQLLLMLRSLYAHPNGQIPAYEWNFSDVNPPVHAWSVWNVFEQDRKKTGKADWDFLERAFQKPQVTEEVMNDDEIYLVQSRPQLGLEESR